MRIRLDALAAELGGTLEGDGSLEITGVASLAEAGPVDVSFIASKKYSGDLEASACGAVIAEKGIDCRIPVIRVENAYLSFADTLDLFYKRVAAIPGIAPTAAVAESADIDPTAEVGPFCHIGERARIGPGSVISSHCVVGADSIVGGQTHLHPRVVVAHRVRIGNNVIVHSGAVIGSDGFGYVQEGGRHRKVPQVGGVDIGDEVEIGANVTIDRATVGTTRIGRGSKIDNLVQIAHNVVVGEHTIIVAQVGVSGSTRIGNGVVLGGQVGVVGHVDIGDGARIGAQSGVIHSVEAGTTCSGMGPLPHRDWLRSQAAFDRLPDLRRRLRNLEERLAALEQRSSEETEERGV